MGSKCSCDVQCTQCFLLQTLCDDCIVGSSEMFFIPFKLMEDDYCTAQI